MALCAWAVDGYPHLQRGLPAAYGCVIVPSCCLGQGRVLGMAHRGLPESSALGRRVRNPRRVPVFLHKMCRVGRAWWTGMAGTLRNGRVCACVSARCLKIQGKRFFGGIARKDCR